MARSPNLPACSVCQKYVVDYDWHTGAGTGLPKRATWSDDPEALHERPAMTKPPCDQCPKKGPENEWKFQLTEANWKTLDLYRQNKATFGRALNEAAVKDALLCSNFAILDQIFSRTDLEQLSEAIRPIA